MNPENTGTVGYRIFLAVILVLIVHYLSAIDSKLSHAVQVEGNVNATVQNTVDVMAATRPLEVNVKNTPSVDVESSRSGTLNVNVVNEQDVRVKNGYSDPVYVRPLN